MKKLLTLVLCWLIAFSAMAETTLKAKTALSAAGGYITSLNKVDGSFEDGTAGWVASTDTIVQTASTEFQGNYKGTWTATGTGTLDLQWTATASNTYEASAQVNVNGEDDMYICAYVGTTETGCKLIPALNKIQKVSVVADSIISSAFHLRLKHTGSDAFSIDVDDGKIEPWTPQAVNLVEQESVSFTGYSSGTNPVVFLTKDTQRSNEKNLIAVSTVGSAGTVSRYRILKACNVAVSASLDFTSSPFYTAIRHFDSMGVIKSAPINSRLNDAASVAYSVKANVGDYFEVNTDGAVMDNTSTVFSITATAISDNVVQSWQDGTEWTSYTPTFSAGFGEVSSVDFKWKRDKGDILIRGSLTTGTVAAALATFTLPNSLTASGSFVTGTFTRNSVINSFGGEFDARLSYSSNSNLIGFRHRNTNSNGSTDLNGNAIFGSSETVTIRDVRIPIAGWSSAPTLYALPTRSEVFSANISASGVATNATQNFVTSCTNATPSICSLWSSFGVAPICESHTVDITKRAEVTASTATTTTVARTDTSTAFNLFCHLK